MASRLRQPPESVGAHSIKIREARAAQRLRHPSPVVPMRHAGALKAPLDHERTSRPAANSETCATQLSRVPLRTATSPLSGFTRPARISSSVDLPEPFGPISSNAVALGNRERDILEQRRRAISFRKPLCADQRWQISCFSRT